MSLQMTNQESLLFHGRKMLPPSNGWQASRMILNVLQCPGQPLEQWSGFKCQESTQVERLRSVLRLKVLGKSAQDEKS